MDILVQQKRTIVFAISFLDQCSLYWQDSLNLVDFGGHTL